jgi:hypothetical protein
MFGTGLLFLSLPIAGMTITPTRNLILGLAPDEAILALADKIDEEAGKNDEQQQAIENLQQYKDEQIKAEEYKLLQQKEALEQNDLNEKIKKCNKFKDSCKERISSLNISIKDKENYLETRYDDLKKDKKRIEDQIKNFERIKLEHKDSPTDSLRKQLKEEEDSIASDEDSLKKEQDNLHNLLNGECKNYENAC